MINPFDSQAVAHRYAAGRPYYHHIALDLAASRYLSRMRACAHSIGREFREPDLATRQPRVEAQDVELFERGLAAGLIRIDGNYVMTQDPLQGTAWLVEGKLASSCWEYLSHAAGYALVTPR